MLFDLETSNFLVGLGTIGLNLATLLLLYAVLTRGTFSTFVRTYTVRFGFAFACALTLGASAVTLYYSEILGALPCSLCWFQRIFLYPQVLIFAIAAFRKDTSASLYAIALSVCGALIALYQHYLQMGGTDAIPCPANGSAADCAVRTLFEFGYITYPFMAFSLFVFIILLMLLASERRSPQAYVGLIQPQR